MHALCLRATAPCLALAVLLSACGGAPDEADPLADLDASAARALNDQLMSDPDLASINEANAALTRSTDSSLPREIDTPEAIRDAQDRAVVLLGGTRSVPDLPAPETLEEEAEESPLVGLDSVAAVVPGAEKCLAQTRYSAIWAARLPEALPVFPRGTVVEAMGTASGKCGLRAIRFRSAVPGDDIARFYFGRGQKAGYSVTYAANETGWQVKGRKAGAHFLVRSRPSLLGNNEIDLVTLGNPGSAAPSATPARRP